MPISNTATSTATATTTTTSATTTTIHLFIYSQRHVAYYDAGDAIQLNVVVLRMAGQAIGNIPSTSVKQIIQMSSQTVAIAC